MRVCFFQKKILGLDMMKLFESTSPDLEVIHLGHCDRYLVLNIHQILELRELFSGAYAMMELNSLIHKEIIRKGVNV